MPKIIKKIGATLPVVVLTCLLTVAVSHGRPPVHPSDVDLGKKRPICTECHDESDSGVVFRRFNHTVYFADNHRSLARQRPEICSMCHQQSSCNDCHGVSTELKLSLRRQTDTYRRTQHRGDYLSRHRIDGRIDPTSCFRCHGSPKTAKTCVRCHG